MEEGAQLRGGHWRALWGGSGQARAPRFAGIPEGLPGNEDWVRHTDHGTGFRYSEHKGSPGMCGKQRKPSSHSVCPSSTLSCGKRINSLKPQVLHLCNYHRGSPTKRKLLNPCLLHEFTGNTVIRFHNLQGLAERA